MNILLISEFEKSYFLAKTLCGQGHHITLISRDPNLCQSLYEAFDIPIVLGDAGNSSILEQTDIREMDIVIAQSENDAKNLVVCELAKKEYCVKSTIAVVNNPANIVFFQQNGVDYCVSEAAVIDSLIKKNDISNSIRKFLPSGDPDIIVNEVTLSARSQILNKKIWEIPFPPQCIVGCIIRNGHAMIPQGTTECKNNDKLIVIASSAVMQEALSLLS